MAYLNVRERRIETKIAYVGAALAGKWTNLEHLRSRKEGHASALEESAGGEILSLDWHPTSVGKFRDCELSVRVVAARDRSGTANLRDVVHDADGVVVVVDADAGAQDKNRETVVALREALAAETGRTVPVVVQVNKTDLATALGGDEIVAALEIASWPLVLASATRGEGVAETLERAIADVLEAMQQNGGASAETSRPPGAVDSAKKMEGNPLLAALRQVLRDTVADQVVEIEARLIARINRDRENAEIIALRRALIEESARTRTALDALREKVEQTQRATVDLRGASVTIAQETARVLDAQVRAVAALDDRMSASVSVVTDTVKSELVRALETRSRSDREHLATAFGQVKRTIEAIDSRPKLGEIAEALAAIAARIDGLTGILQPIAASARALVPRFTEVEAVIARHVGELASRRLGAMEESVGALRAEASDVLARADARTAEVQARLAEVLDELKTRKKGWFG